MRKLLILPLLLAAILFAGCSGPKTTSDRAVDTCGQGNVAYVDADDGQFACKPPPYFSDNDNDNG